MALKAVKDYYGVRVFIGSKEMVLSEKTSQEELSQIAAKKGYEHLVESDTKTSVKELQKP